MMSTRQGFMLIEVLIALVIISMLTGVLFTTVNLVVKGTRDVDAVMDVHTRAIVGMRQLDRDIAGVMVPPQEPKQQQKDQTQQKKLTKIFFSSVKDGNTDVLTFITNNPLQRSWEGSAGVPAPRIARIVYRLVPEKNTKKGAEKRYMLTRQETQELNFDVVAKEPTEGKTTFRAYELIDMVTQFKVTYTPRETDTKKESKESSEATPAKKEITVWDSDSKLDGKDRTIEQMIPSSVRCEFTLVDSKQKKRVVVIEIPIIPDMTPLENSAQPEQQKPPVPNQGAQRR